MNHIARTPALWLPLLIAAAGMVLVCLGTMLGNRIMYGAWWPQERGTE